MAEMCIAAVTDDRKDCSFIVAATVAATIVPCVHDAKQECQRR